MGTVVELMIVAAMIGYEVLTHAHHQAQSSTPHPKLSAPQKPLYLRVPER
jgi:hypothetical protein